MTATTDSALPHKVTQPTRPLNTSPEVTRTSVTETPRSPNDEARIAQPTRALPPEDIPSSSIVSVTTSRAKPLCRVGHWLFVLLGVWCLAWLFDVAVSFTEALLQTRDWLRLPLLVASAALAVAILIWLLREWYAWRRVDALEVRRRTLVTALADNNRSIFLREIEPLLHVWQYSHPDAVRQYRAALPQTDTMEDCVRLFHNLLLNPIDREARELIHKHSLATATGVLLVPHPALDAVFVLWRATALTRAIGELYGAQPTGLAAFRLFVHSLASAIIVFGVDTANDLLFNTLGRGLLETAGKRTAESGVALFRLRKLAQVTQTLCRPLPMDIAEEVVAGSAEDI